jgi:hypothetical protein
VIATRQVQMGMRSAHIPRRKGLRPNVRERGSVTPPSWMSSCPMLSAVLANLRGGRGNRLTDCASRVVHTSCMRVPHFRRSVGILCALKRPSLDSNVAISGFALSECCLYNANAQFAVKYDMTWKCLSRSVPKREPGVLSEEA